MTGFVDRSDAKGEKKRAAKGCSSASSPSNLASFIFHLVTEWNASSASVAFCSARLAASPDECATQGQRPPRKSGQPNSLAASSCPMTEVRNEGSLSGDKLISLVLLPCPISAYPVCGYAVETREAWTGVSYREFFLEHFVPRVSQSSTVQTAPDLVVQERIYQCGKNVYIHICLSQQRSQL